MQVQSTIEGTWEEILTHASELTGRKLRLFVLSDEDPKDIAPPTEKRLSTVGSVLPFAGKWVGDDFEDCLQAVYNSRIQAKF